MIELYNNGVITSVIYSDGPSPFRPAGD